MGRVFDVYLEIVCTAPLDFFGDYADISLESDRLLDQRGPIPCEGVGKVGCWCAECHWGYIDYLETQQTAGDAI